MTDLTRGPIGRHIVSMAGFIAAGLVFQSAYFIVDLYFVSRLGKDALAGVGSAGNVSYLAMGAAQLIGVGCLSLVSQAVGRKDTAYANLVFNQVLLMSLAAAAVTLVSGYAFAAALSDWLGASHATGVYGRDYLYGFIPALACMFPATALASSLRATGVVRPTMLLQSGSVLLNVILAPVLIAGWGSGRPLGTFGAGLASSLASLTSLVVLAFILPRIQTQLHTVRALLTPRLAAWLALMKIGLPAAGEFLLLFLIMVVTYASIRRFGTAAQAGFGIGARVVQSLFVPIMAIAFAAAPIAGQNFGARNRPRVIETFRLSLLFSTLLMFAMTIACQVRPDLLVAPFTNDPAVLAVAGRYMRVISWNFVAIGVVFSCSGMFQALGDTRPSFFSGASRLVTFVLPCLMMARWPGATLVDFWYVSVASAALQAVLSLVLLQREFARKLPDKDGPDYAYPALAGSAPARDVPSDAMAP